MSNTRNMFERIRSLFQSEPEERTVSLDKVQTRFEQATQTELVQTRERAESLRSSVLSALDELKPPLKELTDFEHSNTRVQDVVQNVAEKRLNAIDSFDAPADIELFHDDATALVEQMRGVSEKEHAVLNYVSDSVSNTFRQLNTIEERLERLESFKKTDYGLITDRKRLEEAITKFHDLETTLDERKTELDQIKTLPVRERISELNDELAELEDDPAQTRKDALLKQISTHERARDTLQNDVKTACSKMERGLKKILYQAKNNDTELTVNQIHLLEDIRTGKIAQEFTTPATDITDAVRAAKNLVDTVDLGDRNRAKFEDGAETLEDLAGIREEMETFNEKIAETQAELEELDIDERRQELEEKRDRMKKTLQNRIEKREHLEDTIEDLEQERQELVTTIESILNKHTADEYTVRA